MKKFFKSLFMRANEGFTLVELMVVVAIIGLLSAVAIPNFKKYQAKAKTSEAKLQLAALYTAEMSFFTDYDNFANCLNIMGYDPSDEILNRYYVVGFAAAGGVTGDDSSEDFAMQNGAPDACGIWTGGSEGDGTHDTAADITVGTAVFVYGAGKRVGANPALGGAASAQGTAAAPASCGMSEIPTSCTAGACADGTWNTSRGAAPQDDSQAFIAGAIGTIDNDMIGAANADCWAITSDKALKHARVGY